MTRLTYKQLKALRDVVMGRLPITRYMHKVLHKKGLVYSYFEVTKKGRKALREHREF
jgi:hypothetical protein